MKRLFLAVALILSLATSADAAKALTTPTAVTQPDGTTLMIRLIGDEHFSWYQTTDDVLLVYADKAFYIAQTREDGSLVSTGILAHNIDRRSSDETLAAKAQRPQLFFKADSKEARGMNKASGYPASGRCPHFGKVKIPVIMMEYPDLKFSYSKEDLYTTFEAFFNSSEVKPFSSATYLEGYGSVKQYFMDASGGMFEPEFELYGPYMADSPYATYGKSHGNNAHYTLKNEAISKADADIDFTQYDTNKDGNVDMLYILYAGYGANIGNHPDAIWPHCGSSYSFSADGMRLNIIGMSNELVDGTLRSGIGVLCHEMSHGLGLPDLYWTLTDAPTDERGLPDYNNCGPEFWDLMDGGELVYNGIWPTQYTAWEKEAMEWTLIDELSEPQKVTLYPMNHRNGMAYKVKNPANENEYYVIENYPNNKWNYYQWRWTGLSSQENGLIVTHVNGFGRTTTNMSPNNTYGKPNITLLPADDFLLGLYSNGKECWYQDKKQTINQNMILTDMAGDPYPGKNSVTEITQYKNYAGEDMGSQLPITDITVNSNGSISFWFRKADYIATAITDVQTHDDGKVYTTDGRYVGNSTSALPHGLYITNGRKVVIK